MGIAACISGNVVNLRRTDTSNRNRKCGELASRHIPGDRVMNTKCPARNNGCEFLAEKWHSGSASKYCWPNQGPLRGKSSFKNAVYLSNLLHDFPRFLKKKPVLFSDCW